MQEFTFIVHSHFTCSVKMNSGAFARSVWFIWAFLRECFVTPENINIHIRNIKVLHGLQSVSELHFVLMMCFLSSENCPISELLASPYNFILCESAHRLH